MNPPSEVDVLVVGYGAAGATAAIAAHDAGASVAVIEKTPAGGGNCVHSGGFLFEVDGPHAVEHLDALCFGKTDRSVLEAYARGLPQVPEFIRELGGAAAPVDLDAFGGMLPSWPHFPGAGHVHYRQIVPRPGERPGPALWRVLDAAVRERGIRVALDTPVVDLVLEGERVSGAVLERGGERQAVTAHGGVVLASGGFEADPELRDAYLSLPLVSVGHPGNTGDTLRLAGSAGASLWHMSAFFGWLSFVHPDYPAGFTLDVHAPSFIFLDGDGRRFADETGWEVHDRVRSLTAYLPRRANRPRMPGWIVFDEAARLAGPLHGIVGSPNGYVWSPDNSAEVAAGWITRGSDSDELAAATGLDPTILKDTLAGYAGAVSRRVDYEFGRDPDTLVPLLPPLYAVAMTPGVATASGGPRRDAVARVLRPGGEPIPGLFAAGAAGSIWGHLTEHGGGLTDAIVFGRLAGEHAASGAGRLVTNATT
ncbi:MAG TPA: FAD-dependent oxidoreductase [Solirubrobacteraceae bacterium]|nr:FAD-dependent oxidoreductase [Solirubrobacteraceae bacterium]